MVKVGQVWADCDKRSKGRHIRVMYLWNKRLRLMLHPDPTHAVCSPCAPNGTRRGIRDTCIRMDRFKPGSYRLVKDV